MKALNLLRVVNWVLVVSVMAVGTMVMRGGAAAQTAPVQARAAAQARVDVNSADAKALEGLPGIGPVLAQRIIAGRPYRSLADLERVKGLGKAKVAQLSGQVVFGPAVPALKPSAAAAAGTNLQRGTNREIRQTRESDGSAQREGGLNREIRQTRGRDSGSQVTGSTGRETGVAGAAQPSGGRKTTGKLAAGERININKATAAELERLPGIGPAKAKAIVDDRTQRGEFKTVEEIQRVKGIKSGVFSKIKDSIRTE